MPEIYRGKKQMKIKAANSNDSDTEIKYSLSIKYTSHSSENKRNNAGKIN